MKFTMNKLMSEWQKQFFSWPNIFVFILMGVVVTWAIFNAVKAETISQTWMNIILAVAMAGITFINNRIWRAIIVAPLLIIYILIQCL